MRSGIERQGCFDTFCLFVSHRPLGISEGAQSVIFFLVMRVRTCPHRMCYFFIFSLNIQYSTTILNVKIWHHIFILNYNHTNDQLLEVL